MARTRMSLKEGAVLGLCVVSYCMLFITAPSLFVALMLLTALLLSMLNE